MKELERTILLLKKVVEKTRAENDQLKQGPGVMAGEKLTALQAENNQLKVSQGPGVMAGEKLTALQAENNQLKVRRVGRNKLPHCDLWW